MNTVEPCSFDCAYYDENYPSYERQNPPSPSSAVICANQKPRELMKNCKRWSNA